MAINRALALSLRSGLAVLFAVLVVLQVLSLPGQFRHMAAEDPGFAHLRWPLTAVAAAWILCVQVVVFCIWKLLGMVVHDQIFTIRSLRWVDAILWAIGVAWAILAGLLLIVGFTADDPGGPLLLFVGTAGVAVVGLLMLVMRALLRQATDLRTDLDAVI